MGQEADLDAVMARMTADFLAQNSAGRMLRRALDDVGVGFIPVIDHVTIRTMDIDRRAEEFLALGYRYDETLHFDDWYAKVFRWAGYPALFVDQAYPDDRGKTSIIPAGSRNSVIRCFTMWRSVSKTSSRPFSN